MSGGWLLLCEFLALEMCFRESVEGIRVRADRRALERGRELRGACCEASEMGWVARRSQSSLALAYAIWKYSFSRASRSIVVLDVCVALFEFLMPGNASEKVKRGFE